MKLKFIPRTLFLDLYFFVFFFSNEDGLVENPEFFRKLFKARRNYKYCFC